MLPPREPGWLTEDQDGTNVFVPGLMGAGLLVSMAMLAADGFRRLDPFRAEATRERATQAHAEGRVRDLHAVASGTTATPPRFTRDPRGRPVSLTGGVLALGLAVAAVWWSFVIYNSTGSVLSDRGWTLGGGGLIALALAGPGLVLLASGLLGSATPDWLTRLATRPPLGRAAGVESDDLDTVDKEN
ncbi:MAG: hypothetical protein ACRDWD_08530 [Acidimicrobiia bacterium]